MSHKNTFKFTILFAAWLTAIMAGLLLVGHVEATPQLPPPSADLARNITAFINATITQHPELQNLAGANRSRIITFKHRPEASDMEKYGMELLSLPEMHFVTGMIPDAVIDELQKLGIVDSVVEDKVIRVAQNSSSPLVVQQSPANWVSRAFEESMTLTLET